MNVVIIGGSGGIGRAIIENLANKDNVDSIWATYHRNMPRARHPKVIWQPLNLVEESSVKSWATSLGEVDWLVNAAGILHTPRTQPEKTIRRFDPDFFLCNMASNALPALLLAKHTQDKFNHGRPALFAAVSAKVGSIEDNRLGGWYSYRASKAALNMAMKTLAIEWKRVLPNVTVAALHPGTTDTALSKPFQKNVQAERLFSPDRSAGYMVDVMKSLTPEVTGRFWSYDGENLPW